MSPASWLRQRLPLGEPEPPAGDSPATGPSTPGDVTPGAAAARTADRARSVTPPGRRDRTGEPDNQGARSGEAHTDRPPVGVPQGSPDVESPGAEREPTGKQPVVSPAGTDVPFDGASVDEELFDDAETAAPVRPAGPARPADPAEKSRWRRRREWRQEERARRYSARRSVRFPIFTRAILLWMMLFALVGVAFGASGAFWWTHFNTQVAELRDETRDLDERSTEALSQIEAQRNTAITEIDEALQPLQGFLSEARMIQFAEFFAPSVWFVATLDEAGEPAVGSAFAVVSTENETLLVTSYATVEASSVQPGPEILLRNVGTEVEAQLVNVDPGRDLALVSIPRGDIPILEWSTDEEQARALGSRVFPVSGFGGSGASLSSGVVIEQNASGFLHTGAVGNFAQGGPIVSPNGRVLGVASVTYRPFGFDPGNVYFSVRVNEVCAALLDCGGGARRAPDASPPAAPDDLPDTPVEPD